MASKSPVQAFASVGSSRTGVPVAGEVAADCASDVGDIPTRANASAAVMTVRSIAPPLHRLRPAPLSTICAERAKCRARGCRDVERIPQESGSEQSGAYWPGRLHAFGRAV